MLLLLVFSGTKAMADDYDCLIFVKQDGTTQAIATENLEITFASGMAKLVNTATQESIALADLTKMYFGNTTGIDDISIATSSQAVIVYTTTGILLKTFSNLNEAKGQLKKGIYVMKTAQGTRKMIVR